MLFFVAKAGGNNVKSNQTIDSDIIKKVLLAVQKKATGYTTKEVVEEFAHDEKAGKDVLLKRKVSKFYVPADISAAKFLLEVDANNSQTDYSNLTDEEMDQVAIKLFKEYQELTDKDIFVEIKGEENENGDN